MTAFANTPPEMWEAPPPEMWEAPPPEMLGAPPPEVFSPSESAICFTLPRADQPLLDWMIMAADLFTQNPARYQLTADQARTLASLTQQFQSAWHRCILAARTAEDTAAKNRARDAARSAFLPVIQFIKARVEIDLEAKFMLGFKRTIARKQPIAPPKSFPLLSIIAAGDGTHTLCFADSNSPGKRRKPRGAHSLDLHIFIGPGVITNPEPPPAAPPPRATTTPAGFSFAGKRPGPWSTFGGSGDSGDSGSSGGLPIADRTRDWPK